MRRYQWVASRTRDFSLTLMHTSLYTCDGDALNLDDKIKRDNLKWNFSES